MKKQIFILLLSSFLLGKNLAFGTSYDPERDNNLDGSQKIILDENTQISKSLSWMDLTSLPVTFLTSLFDPFTNQKAQEFYRDQITQVVDEGITNYAYDKAKQCLTTLKNNPRDSFLIGCSMALGLTSVEEYSPLIPLTVGLFNSAKYSQALWDVADLIASKTTLEKTLKIALYSGALYSIASMPVAAALD